MSKLYTWCFACGPDNPIGLKLKFREENGQYIANFTAGPEHQGYDGILHGGIVSTLLDEIMTRYPYHLGFHTVTARLEVRFLKPTPIGVQLTVVGWIVKQKGRLFELRGEVRLPDGTVTAEGQAAAMVRAAVQKEVGD